MSSPSFQSDESSALYLRNVATKNRLYPRSVLGCDLARLRTTCKQWRKEGSFVIFSTGVFDVLHLNHLLALTKYRIIGAKEYAANQKLMGTLASPELLRALAASNKIRLVLSIDSDEHAAHNKAFRADKANCARPILSWESRALMLANQYVGEPPSLHPLVDAITSHGLGSCAQQHCTKHESDFVASVVQPDLVVLGEHNHTTRQKVQRNSSLRHVKVINTKECSAHYDTLLGGQVTSTAIITRAARPSAY